MKGRIMESQTNAMSRRIFLGKAGGVVLGVSGALASDSHTSVPDNPLQSNRKIRIGVVGGGFGCSFQWHEHPNCIVEAVSDLQEERKKTLMEVYQCSKNYDSLEELVMDDNLEAVGVFTDAPSHGRHIESTANRWVVAGQPERRKPDRRQLR